MIDHPTEQVYIVEEDFGFWNSPITAEKAAAGAKKIVSLETDGKDIYWIEMRPENKGRYTIVQAGTGDLTDPEFNARSAVHEYGGASFNVKDGAVVSTKFPDHAVYIKHPNDEWKLLIDDKKTRFADFIITSSGVVAIGETHHEGDDVENFLALISDESFTKLASGHDFYASPAMSPDETKIAFLCWNHPDMPWTRTELWVLENGELNKIAGEDEAIFQPQWSPDGTLYFISDRDEWWNLYRYTGEKVEKVFSIQAELGRPLWVLGLSTYAFFKDNIFFSIFQDGVGHLGQYDLTTKQYKILKREGIQFNEIRAGDDFITFVESFSDKASHIVKFPQESLVFTEEEEQVDPQYLSQPEHIAFPSANGRKAFGYFYKPVNRDYQGKKGTYPPLIVMIHGGPTSQAKPELNLAKQFWTSRGFAILDVNYAGSTGYGRSFRMLLNDNWGIFDVEDCIFGVNTLKEKGLVDPNWCFIRGGSAGGYTTLAALAFHDTFKGGASYYGVADLALLANDTHKFESRYLDSLLGKDPNIWQERSPIHHMEKFTEPLIIFQGTEDKIVPPNQAEMIYHALKTNGVKTELVLYQGEQHGFRKKENIIDSLKKELNFYRSLIKATSPRG